MTNTDNHGAAAPAGQSTPKRRWGKRVLIGALLVGLGGLAGFAGGVRSAPALFFHGISHHKFDAERVAARIDRGVERALSHIDATAEQKTKVSTIAKAAASDLTALGFNPWDVRTKFNELLRADTIDPAAFEALRAEQISQIDTASKRAVLALTEAAAVLTPEQRRELIDRWQHRHERWSR